MFEKLKIEKIAECFTSQNSKVLIFCNWDDVNKIKLELKNATTEAFSFGGDFDDKKDGINGLSVYHGGREFVFIDERDAIRVMQIIIDNK